MTTRKASSTAKSAAPKKAPKPKKKPATAAKVNDAATVREPVVLPRPERSTPKRGIFRAFSQKDRSPPMFKQGAKFSDDDFWQGASAGSTHRTDGATGPEQSTSADDIPRSASLSDNVSDAVRAAYNVIDQQIREGQAAAVALNKSGKLLDAKNVPAILNRLVQTYSDLGAVWVDLLLAATERNGKESSGSGEAGASTTTGPSSSASAATSIAVEVTAQTRVSVRARLYRNASGALSAMPLRGTGADAPMIDSVDIVSGPLVKLTVPHDLPSGDYHGMIIEHGADEPAGSISLKVP